MTDPLPHHILAALEYDPLWLDLGILSPDALLAQFAEFQTGDDPNPEHYRYRTITAFLAAQPSLTDTLLDGISHLLRIDPDQLMAPAVRGHFLLPHPGLTNDQFERLAALPETQAQNPREVLRARFLRRLAAGEWTPELLDHCITRGDSVVQLALLDHPRLDRPTLSHLATNGCNKAIRNMAAQRLRSRRFPPT